MLSPEAELRGIVREVSEPSAASEGDYLPLRRVRSIVAQAIRATRQLANVEHRGTSEHAPSLCKQYSQTLELALFDLDRTSDPY